MKKSKAGRKPVYVGRLAEQIAKVIKQHGLTGAVEYLATAGLQTKPGKGRQPLKISMSTLGKIAKRYKRRLGIKLTVGRPPKVVA